MQICKSLIYTFSFGLGYFKFFLFQDVQVVFAELCIVVDIDAQFPEHKEIRSVP